MSESRDETTGPDSTVPGGVYADDLFCPDCSYSLRGLTSERCPECGLKLDFIESDTPVIPWERRRELGRLRAYWQTVLQIVFRRKLFCRAVFRPVSHGDAQRFRCVTIAHAAIPAMLAPLACHITGARFAAEAAADYGPWFVILVYVCALFALVAFTGLPSYFFHPRFLPVELQDRALAMSYYGTAPLAWTTVGVLAIVAGVALYDLRRIVDLLLIALGCMFLFALVGTCWEVFISLATRTLRRTTAVLWVAIALPVLWGLAGSLILVGLPLIALYLVVILYSLG